MKYAVFYRNLNLGRPRCPDRAQFEAAFLTNGTLVFEARTRAWNTVVRLVDKHA